MHKQYRHLFPARMMALLLGFLLSPAIVQAQQHPRPPETSPAIRKPSEPVPMPDYGRPPTGPRLRMDSPHPIPCGCPVTKQDLEAGPQPGDATQMCAVINANWPQWSRNAGSNKVGFNVLIEAMNSQPDNSTDPDLNRSLAATVLAAICRYLHDFPPSPPSVALADLTDVNNGWVNRKMLDPYFSACWASTTNLRQLKMKGGDITFADSGQPSFPRMQQGGIGDCFFYSGLGWLALHYPQAIQQAIQGSYPHYTVSFSGSVPLKTVDSSPRNVDVVLSDCEVIYANSACAVTDGVWSAVLEKAVGIALEGSSWLVHQDPAEPISNIAYGGGAGAIQTLFTGGTSSTLCKKFESNYCTDSAPWTAESLAGILAKNLGGTDKLMVQALIMNSNADGLPYQHWYAVLNYDAANQVLMVWNPWGVNSAPDSVLPDCPPVPRIPTTRVGGVFLISLSSFLQDFDRLTYENSPSSPSQMERRFRR